LEFRPDCRHDYLFTTTQSNRIHASRMQIIWKRVLQDSGITRPGVSLHTLRHSAATLLLQNGVDLVSIQQILGHTRLDTTAVYLHVGGAELRKAVSAHPLCADTGSGEDVDG
ncbi:MAG: tyrosine-type recombinase/integrase, partial [Armatimonadetes bacterium]|nr:tyrosine-type recombinase/integrase [Armatimonadota bacterium]